MRTEISNVRDKVSNKDNETVDTIREAFQALQQKSLKLFEMAYKKVRTAILYNVDFVLNVFLFLWQEDLVI